LNRAICHDETFIFDESTGLLTTSLSAQPLVLLGFRVGASSLRRYKGIKTAAVQ
jgi:hypothetical protein